MNKLKSVVSSIVVALLLITMSCGNMLTSSSSEDYSVTANSRAVASGRGAGVVETAGRLQVHGNLVASESGEKISLIGMSMFWSNWAGSYYNASTVDYLVDNFEVSLVRATYGVPHGGEPDGDYSKIEAIVDQAIARGIYVLIDWHTEGDAWGHQDAARDFFNHFSAKYGEYANVLYELWNEPIDSGVDSLRRWNQEMADIIRTNDPDNLVICGSDTWSQNPQSYTINDPNAAYTFHGYFDDPNNGAVHISQFYKNVDAAMNQGSAVFVTEFGAHYNSTSGTSEIMNACIERGISMAAWSVNDKVEPWSIFNGFMGSLTDIGNFYQERMSTWPPIGTKTTWGKRVMDTGNVILSESDKGNFVANVTNTGSDPWSVQVSRDGVLLEQGEVYTITFSAKADSQRSMNLAVGYDIAADPYYISFYDPEPIVLTDFYQQYKVTFTMNDATYSDTKLAFDMGNITGSNVNTNIYVNDFLLAKGGDGAPVANAGADVVITNPTSSVTLDGSDSYDSDGTIESYVWSGNGINSTSEIVDITELLVDESTSYTYTLTVTDDEGNTDTDTITITVKPESSSQIAAIKSNINGSYICADNAGVDSLVADRTAVGGWEQFEIIPQTDGTVALKSLANDLYVACEIDNGSILKARSTSVDDWEKFILEDQGNGTVAIKAVANGKYLVNELFKNNAIVARSDNPADTWESFTIEYQ